MRQIALSIVLVGLVMACSAGCKKKAKPAAGTAAEKTVSSKPSSSAEPAPQQARVAPEHLREKPSRDDCEAACAVLVKHEIEGLSGSVRGTPEEKANVIGPLKQRQRPETKRCVARCLATFSRATAECLRLSDGAVNAAMDCVEATGQAGAPAR